MMNVKEGIAADLEPRTRVFAVRVIRRRTRPRRCTCLEWIEDRTLLSTFIVTNTADAGPGSLRQAIVDSNAATGSGEPDRLRHRGRRRANDRATTPPARDHRRPS